jgi:flagellar protein FlaF
MSPANEQVDAYKTHQRKFESHRDIEARALLSAANELEEARRSGAPMPVYTEALRRNQRMWTIFQVALCDPENPLQPQLKGLLLNLCRYVDRVSFNAIKQHRPDLLGGLISINRQIAAGLSVQQKTAEQLPQATAPTASAQGAPPPPDVPVTSVMTTA